MPMWNDLIDPAVLTGYVRASMEDYEQAKGSLARWLPNREVPDVSVRFVKGGAGLVEIARWRSFDAEPEIGRNQPMQRVVVDLQPISLNRVVSEHDLARAMNADDESIRNLVQRTAVDVGQAIVDAVELLRGIVLTTGKATIAQENLQVETNFGRSPSHTLTAPTLWSDTSADRLDWLEQMRQLYVADNGQEPGALLMSRRVMNALCAGDQFKTVFLGGGQRNATPDQVGDVLAGSGLPPVTVYDRQVMDKPRLVAGGAPAPARPPVTNVTNVTVNATYPTAEPTSVTANRVLQTVAAIGRG